MSAFVASGAVETAANLRVVIEDSLAWPKQLEIRLGNGESVQKTFEGKMIYPPNVAIPLDKTQLDEGVAEIAIELPPSARKRYGQFQTCFYLDGISEACGDTKWEGKLAEAPKRRTLGRHRRIRKARLSEPQSALRRKSGKILIPTNSIGYQSKIGELERAPS